MIGDKRRNRNFDNLTHIETILKKFLNQLKLNFF